MSHMNFHAKNKIGRIIHSSCETLFQKDKIVPEEFEKNAKDQEENTKM